MGLGWIGMGRKFAFRQGGDSWSTYWLTHLFYELWDVSDKSGNVTGLIRGDTLTIAGVAGSETYKIPDTSAYIGLDSDYVWFKLNEDQRTVTTAELIGYDFSRTVVLYDDAIPNTIKYIGIRNTDVATADQTDRLHIDFQLPLFWSGVLNLNGHVKDNRPLAQRYAWTIDTVYESEVMDYHALLTTKLAGSTYTAIDTMVKTIKTGFAIATLDLQFDQILLLLNETQEAGLKNIVKNAYHATNDGVDWAQWEGFTGNNKGVLRTGYNPYGFPGIYKQDNAGFCLCIGNNLSYLSTVNIHGTSTTSYVRIGMNPFRLSTNARVYINQVTAAEVNPGNTSIGYTMGRRTASNACNAFKNKTKGPDNTTASSGAILNHEILLCGRILNDNIDFYNAHNIRLWAIGKSFTDEQQAILVDAFETYLDTFGKGVL